jgi:hypothetical protein
MRTEISGLWSIPDHQQGIGCKAPRSDTTEPYGAYAARPPARRAYAPEGGGIEGNAADDAFMVDQGIKVSLT